jgi:hypothetical protein
MPPEFESFHLHGHGVFQIVPALGVAAVVLHGDVEEEGGPFVSSVQR